MNEMITGIDLSFVTFRGQCAARPSRRARAEAAHAVATPYREDAVVPRNVGLDREGIHVILPRTTVESNAYNARAPMQKQDLQTRAPYLCAAEIEVTQTNKAGRVIVASLRFSDDRVKVATKSVRVALSRVFINFYLTNCVMPSEDWSHNPIMPEKVLQNYRTTTTAKTTSTEQNATKVGARASVSPSLVGQGENIAKSETGRETETTRELNREVALIRARGTEKHPSWIILHPPDEPYLHGTILQKDRFARVEWERGWCHLVTTIEIPRDGLVIEDAGTFVKFANKRGLLKHLLARSLCSKEFQLEEISIRDDS
jgi:hypothetical protein